MLNNKDGYTRICSGLEIQSEMRGGLLVGFAIDSVDRETRTLFYLDKTELKNLINHLSLIMTKEDS